MGATRFDKKSCLRFKLVHRSVADDDGTAVVSGDREFVPMNAEAHARIGLLRGDGAPRRVTFADEHLSDNGDEVANLEEARGHEAGEAAKYGVFFDDRQYDYTRHLRAIGASPDGVFVPAAGLASAPADEDLPSVAHDSRLDAHDEGLQEVMAALDDDAFVDEHGFADDLVVRMDRSYTGVLCPAESEDDAECASECSDSDSLVYGSVAPTATTVRSRAPSTFAPSLATTSIEGKFDAVLRLYDSDENGSALDAFSDEADEDALLAALADFDDNRMEYMRPGAAEKLRAATDVLGALRAVAGPVPAHVLDAEVPASSSAEDDESDDSSADLRPSTVPVAGASLSLSFQPAIIRETPIRICARTGMPVGADSIRRTPRPHNDASSDSDADNTPRENKGAARARTEGAEEKRARKAAVRAERRTARASKKGARLAAAAAQ